MREWLRLATQPAVVRRALGYAVVVGAVLVTINHGDRIATGRVVAGDLLKMALTVCVPYLVSTFSSVGALRSRETAAPDCAARHASERTPPGDPRRDSG